MVSSTPEVRQLNRERIRRELHVRKTCTKAEMAAWTGLSVSTCNTILNEMRADGEIIRTSQEDGYVGRPASRFEYNADYLHVLVVYVVTALQDRHDFRELAAKAALIVCCTFDPEVIVLLGHGMDTDDLQAIRLLISNAVTESHVRHARRDRVDLRRSHLRLGDDRQPCRGQPASSGCGGARSVTFYRRAVRLEPRSHLARGARGRERDLCDRGRKPARGRPAGAVPGPQQRPGGAANRVVVRARLDRRRILHASGDGRCSFVDARDIAGVANAVLTEPGHHRREYALSGPDAITMSDVAKRSGAPWGGRSKQSRWKCLSTKGISRVLATIWRPSTPSPTSTVQ